MTDTPFDLSVVIPSYNRNDCVVTTLEKLFESDCTGLGRIEVLIIDDGSPKPIGELIESLDTPAEFDVRVIRTSNGGIGAARNRGYAEAASDVVIFLDDDVLVAPDTLRKIVDAHTAEPCGVLFGIYPFATHESESLRKFAARVYDYDLITDDPAFAYVDDITSGLLSVRKSILRVGQLYQDDLRTPAAEEHELIFRFNRAGQKIAHARHVTGIHNHHLELKWMADQQYKYGQAAAEAFEKYPDVLEMPRLAAMKATLDSKGPVGFLKDLASSQTGRLLLLSIARSIQWFNPNGDHDRVYGILTAAYLRGGYKDGLKLLRSTIR